MSFVSNNAFGLLPCSFFSLNLFFFFLCTEFSIFSKLQHGGEWSYHSSCITTIRAVSQARAPTPIGDLSTIAFGFVAKIESNTKLLVVDFIRLLGWFCSAFATATGGASVDDIAAEESRKWLANQQSWYVYKMHNVSFMLYMYM